MGQIFSKKKKIKVLNLISKRDRLTDSHLNLSGEIIIDFDSFFRNVNVFINIKGWTPQEVYLYCNNTPMVSPAKSPNVSFDNVSLDTIH